VPLTAGSGWTNSIEDAFLSFADSGMSTAQFTQGSTVWTRTVYSIHPVDSAPILLIRDSFQNEAGPMVFQMNLMAQGDVATPAGSYTPPPSSYANNGQLPSLGSVFTLNPGINRLGFTGQWGVNFDVYTVSRAAQDARIGNWSQTWNPSTETDEFKAATGQTFQETQDTLRLKSDGPFEVLLLPYASGQRPADLKVSQDSSGNTVVSANGGITTIGDQFYSYGDATRSVLTAFGVSSVSALGMSIAGGPMEAAMSGNHVTLTVDGAVGLRTLGLAGNWQVDPNSANAPISWNGSQWQVNYQGGGPLTITLDRVS
jgi:hypothetical protein